MKTLNWKHTNWTARNFIFTVGQEIIGQLTFTSSWNFNAVYTDKEANLKFAQKNFFDKDVVITKDGDSVGTIEFKLFGEQILKLPSGEKFTLSSSFWGKEVYWKNQDGETVIKYETATMSSMGKGLITLPSILKPETEKLLVASGLLARQIVHKRAALVVVIILPILAASRRH